MGQRGFTCHENSGTGDCIFQALTTIVWGVLIHHDQMRMRLWVVDRVRENPKLYNMIGPMQEFKKHCQEMSKGGTAATHIEL